MACAPCAARRAALLDSMKSGDVKGAIKQAAIGASELVANAAEAVMRPAHPRNPPLDPLPEYEQIASGTDPVTGQTTYTLQLKPKD